MSNHLLPNVHMLRLQRSTVVESQLPPLADRYQLVSQFTLISKG